MVGCTRTRVLQCSHASVGLAQARPNKPVFFIYVYEDMVVYREGWFVNYSYRSVPQIRAPPPPPPFAILALVQNAGYAGCNIFSRNYAPPSGAPPT